MPKVLLLTNKIPHYRTPLYAKVAGEFDLTIAHAGKPVGNVAFSEIILNERKVGPFFLYDGTIECNNYDVVIVYFNIRLINLYKILFKFKKKYKVIVYGIGVAGSYTKKYDSDFLTSLICYNILKFADGAIFYDDYPIIKYAAKRIIREKMFAAFNTVVNISGPITPISSRSTFLFIGTLYKEKGIFQLLEAYKIGLKRGILLPTLNIIGDGPYKGEIENWINENNFQSNIILLGQIINENELKYYFDRSICCISPGQAGLSVQKSFAYGVPFLTSNHPFSGGEFTSIVENVTGFFYNGRTDDLLNKMQSILLNPKLGIISENCKFFYDRFRSGDVWSHGFCSAIDYVYNK